MRKIVVTAALTAAALAVTAGAASAASSHPASHAFGSRPGTVAYEADNGTTWTLSDHTGAGGRVSDSGAEAGYADAGVVVDLGPAADFTGVHVTGSLNLAENIWITDGSEAPASPGRRKGSRRPARDPEHQATPPLGVILSGPSVSG